MTVKELVEMLDDIGGLADEHLQVELEVAVEDSRNGDLLPVNDVIARDIAMEPHVVIVVGDLES